jgi:spermidine synthase
MSDGFKCSYELDVDDGKDGVLIEGITKYQSYKVVTSKLYGRCLVIDGLLQSTTHDERIYHESIVHPAMFAHVAGGSGAVRDVMIVGGGKFDIGCYG